MWTNAFKSDAPSNWGRWYVDLAAAGDYAVEVWAEPGFAVHRAARYMVAHGGVEDTVTVDLSATGWVRLGVFSFAAGGGQHVNVYDNYPDEVPADQHIPADAIRLVPATVEPPGQEPPAGEEPPAAEEPGTGPLDPPGTGGEGRPTGGTPPGAEPPAAAPGTGEPAGDPPGNTAGLRGGCAVGGTPAGASPWLLFVLGLLLPLIRRGRRG
jgi:hypothetical protein